MRAIGRECLTTDRSAGMAPGLALAVALLFSATGGYAAGADDSSDSSKLTRLVAITAPSQEAVLAPALLGRIQRFVVELGQTVAAGDLLVELDASVQRARVETARIPAESTLEIDLARVRMERAEAEFERIRKLGIQMASAKELADARADMQVRRIEHKLAVRSHDRAVADYKYQQALLDQRRLRAPFSGYVSARLRDIGDSVKESEGVVVVAQLDPLVVWLDCPLEFATRLRTGDELTLEPAYEQWSARTATIAFINRVADAASQTFKIKLSVSNRGAEWPAGLKVYVLIPSGREVVAGAVVERASTRSRSEK